MGVSRVGSLVWGLVGFELLDCRVWGFEVRLLCVSQLGIHGVAVAGMGRRV